MAAAGPTFGTDGNMFVATDGGAAANSNDANAVVALDRQTLKPKDWFSPGKTAFAASPVAFQYKGKHLIVAANADGRLYVLDAASLGGADHRTPLSASAPYSTPADFAPGALATAEGADGSRWIFAAAGPPARRRHDFPSTNGAVTNGAIAAYKLIDQAGVADTAARMDFARHGVADAADHRQRRRLCDLERRVSSSRRADDCGAAGSAFKARCAVRAWTR